MKIYSHRISLLALAVAFAFSPAAFAKPPAGAGGKGGPGHGRRGDDFRGVIHALFAAHEKVERSVELTETGYRARTVSDDPKVASMIQEHVAQMEARLEGGFGVRHWDPAFAELREHYDDMNIALESVDGGVAVVVIGKTPEAILVAKNHAKIISGFVAGGNQQMHATHAAALPSPGTASEVAANDSKTAGCANCPSGKSAAAAASGCCQDKQCGKGDKPCCAARAGKQPAAVTSE